MSQLTQSFYRNVQAVCMTDNESDLIRYMSNDGFVLLKQLYSTEIHVRKRQREREKGHGEGCGVCLDDIKRSFLPGFGRFSDQITFTLLFACFQ